MKFKNDSDWVFQVVDVNGQEVDLESGETLEIHSDVAIVFQVAEGGGLILEVRTNLPDAAAHDVGGDGGLASVSGGGT